MKICGFLRKNIGFAEMLWKIRKLLFHAFPFPPPPFPYVYFPFVSSTAKFSLFTNIQNKKFLISLEPSNIISILAVGSLSGIGI